MGRDEAKAWWYKEQWDISQPSSAMRFRLTFFQYLYTRWPRWISFPMEWGISGQCMCPYSAYLPFFVEKRNRSNLLCFGKINIEIKWIRTNSFIKIRWFSCKSWNELEIENNLVFETENIISTLLIYTALFDSIWLVSDKQSFLLCSIRTIDIVIHKNYQDYQLFQRIETYI